MTFGEWMAGSAFIGTLITVLAWPIAAFCGLAGMPTPGHEALWSTNVLLAALSCGLSAMFIFMVGSLLFWTWEAWSWKRRQQ